MHSTRRTVPFFPVPLPDYTHTEPYNSSFQTPVSQGFITIACQQAYLVQSSPSNQSPNKQTPITLRSPKFMIPIQRMHRSRQFHMTLAIIAGMSRIRSLARFRRIQMNQRRLSRPLVR